MFTDSPRLRKLLTGVADDASSHRIKLQTMLIYMAWSGSVTSIGNVSVGILIVDEQDKCEEFPSKKEARFEDLVAERTLAFDKFGSIKVWNSRITSYNVCYTKLLRDQGPLQAQPIRSGTVGAAHRDRSGRPGGNGDG